MTVLDKVKLLKKYVEIDSASVDPMIDLVINKIIEREVSLLIDLKNRLLNQLEAFENKYTLNSSEFYKLYTKGEMGDDMDFIEWASTVEMLSNTDKRLTLLKKKI